MTRISEARGHPITRLIGWPRCVVLGLVALVTLGGCRLAEGPEAPPAPPDVELEGPSLAAGPTDDAPARMREVQRLLTEAQRALEAESFSLALERAQQVEDGFADVPGTASALGITARAHRGLESWDAAEAAASRFVELLSPGDPGHPEATLLLAEIRADAGHPGDLDALFGVPDDAPSSVLDAAEELAVRLAGDLDLSSLRELVEQAPQHPRLLPPFQVELAVRRSLMGDTDEGRELAERALALEPGEAVAERARHIAEGRVEELDRSAVVLGAVLSEGGPPSLRQLSAEIRAGIEVALVEAEETGLPVRFEVLDDGGSETRAGELVAQLEGAGATAVIGPLVELAVAAAVRARRGGVPLVSPTARMVPQGAGSVFSLTGVDPSASRALARAALQAGIRDVMVVHPRIAEMEEEAQHFRAAFQEAGGSVRRTLSYPPGTTSFVEPFGEVVRQRPSGLVLLLPPEDVDLVAPQLAYYGVVDLDIAILGNEAWSSEAVLQEVGTRHTEGVLTVSSRGGEGRFGPRWDTFVQAYESHFQRTLRSPASALGYDAARLLLHAAALGDGTPEGTARALETIREFPGATGLLEVVDGRIQRSYQPVRIENGRPVPIQP